VVRASLPATRSILSTTRSEGVSLQASLFNLVAVFSVSHLEYSVSQMTELLGVAGVLAAAVIYNEEQKEVVFLGDIHGSRVSGMGERLTAVAGRYAKPVEFCLVAIKEEEPKYVESNQYFQSRPVLLGIAGC
jgi:hypothetical protein